MKTEYFDCSCGSAEHTLRFVIDKDDSGTSLYTEVHLSDTVWYERLWKGIKYILGYKSKYGNFDCWLMDKEDKERLIELVNRTNE